MSQAQNQEAQSQQQESLALARAIEEVLKEAKQLGRDLSLYEAVVNALRGESFKVPAEVVAKVGYGFVEIETPFGGVVVRDPMDGKTLIRKLADLLTSRDTIAKFLTDAVAPAMERLRKLEEEVRNLRKRVNDWDP